MCCGVSAANSQAEGKELVVLRRPKECMNEVAKLVRRQCSEDRQGCCLGARSWQEPLGGSQCPWKLKQSEKSPSWYHSDELHITSELQVDVVYMTGPETSLCSRCDHLANAISSNMSESIVARGVQPHGRDQVPSRVGHVCASMRRLHRVGVRHALHRRLACPQVRSRTQRGRTATTWCITRLSSTGRPCVPRCSWPR